MMKKILSISLLLTIFLSPFSALAQDISPTSSYDWEKYKGQNKTINVYNWGEYMDNTVVNINKIFTEKTGVDVNYTTYASNEELYARLKGGGVNYDVLIPSEYMISRMISEQMLSPLNYDNIPNANYIHQEFKKQSHDPEDKYSVPYTWGTVGILYNTEIVKEPVDSWDILWDEKYKGKTLMFDNSRDAFGIALKKLGFSQNTKDLAEIDLATKELIAQKPIIQAYVMDQIFDKMISGEAALAPYYAGDALTIIKDNPKVKFIIPKEGTNKFIDSTCIPATSQQKDLAELYINFLNEPEIAKANIEYIGYSTPNHRALALLDQEVQNSVISYPSSEVLQNTEVFLNLPEDLQAYIDEKWLAVKGVGSEGSNSMLMPFLLLLALSLVVYLNISKARKKKRENY